MENYYIYVLQLNQKPLTQAQFTDLFNSHFEAVRNYIYYRSGNSNTATDIAQEAFLKIWEKQPADTSKLTGLLYKISGDLFVSSYRKEKTVKEFKLQVKAEASHDTPEERMQFEELQQQYEKALAQLPEKQRVVFLMHRMDHYKYHEIADHLGLSVKAIEKRMKHALSFLRNELGTL